MRHSIQYFFPEKLHFQHFYVCSGFDVFVHLLRKILYLKALSYDKDDEPRTTVDSL